MNVSKSINYLLACFTALYFNMTIVNALEFPSALPFTDEERIKCAETIDEKLNEPEYRIALLCAASTAQLKDRDFWELTEERFKAFIAKNPDDMEAKAYYGNLQTIEALFSSNLGKKMLASRKGFITLDKAVSKSPDHLGVRLIRAFNSINIPKFLKRRKYAYTDFEYIFDKIKDKQGYSDLKSLVLFWLGKLHIEDGNKAKAKEYLETAKQLDDSKFRKELRELLKQVT